VGFDAAVLALRADRALRRAVGWCAGLGVLALYALSWGTALLPGASGRPPVNALVLLALYALPVAVGSGCGCDRAAFAAAPGPGCRPWAGRCC